MKTSEITIGKTYLFFKTEIEHRKDLIGQNITVVGKKIKGKGVVKNTYTSHIHGGHVVYKTNLGRNVSACELKELLTYKIGENE